MPPPVSSHRRRAALGDRPPPPNRAWPRTTTWPRSGELHRVAEQVHQDLPQPQRTRRAPLRARPLPTRPRASIAARLARGPPANPASRDCLPATRRAVDTVPRRRRAVPRPMPRQIEHVVQDAEQRARRGFDRGRQNPVLAGGELRLQQQLGRARGCRPIGVRISWLMWARNEVLVRSDASAASLAASAAASLRMRSVASTIVATTWGAPSIRA